MWYVEICIKWLKCVFVFFFLVLKFYDLIKYYINGNWVIDLLKGYKVVGIIVYYIRFCRNNENEECFIVDGLIIEDFDVMVRKCMFVVIRVFNNWVLLIEWKKGCI